MHKHTLKFYCNNILNEWSPYFDKHWLVVIYTLVYITSIYIHLCIYSMCEFSVFSLNLHIVVHLDNFYCILTGETNIHFHILSM